MFYDGDLQSGISKALQESKLVTCFVADGDVESRSWENDFLEDPSIKSTLVDESVLLRLIAGSQEAGYLAAIFPLPKTPTLVIIQNGQLREYLTAGISKEEFLKRIKVVLESHKAAAYAETRPSPDVTPGGASSSPIVPSEIQQPAQAGTENPPRNTVSAEGASSRVVQDLLAERSARLEAHKKDQEAEEKTRRIAEAKARKAALEEETPEGSDKSADMKYALMQKKRQQEAREERARILKRVEDDKAERRERDAQRRAQNKTSESLRDSPAAASSSLVPSQLSQSRECALQIRLFDGSTIRSRFSPQGTLRANVRPWIDKEQIIDVPYTFKHILTPLPNKNISISDEEQSLQSQGLTPSATLILVPVHGYTSAYDDSSMTGYMSRGFNLGYGLVSSGVGMVTGVLGSILGGGAAQTSPLAEPTPISNVPASNINVRTLRDQERSEDHQLYNGNALNFEPRKDDEDKKDE